MKNSVVDKLTEYISGRSCGIMGFGVSNRPLTKRLCDMGVDVSVMDRMSIDMLGDEAAELSHRGVRFICGEDCFSSPRGNVIFRSPGIRPDIDGILKAIDAGAELTSEIELFLELSDADTFAVTGSDGKTTSTTLTGKILETESKKRSSGKVFVGGNIGTPLLDRISDISDIDRVVMELSSFQLMTVKKAPKFSAITNISPNHLDWHTDMDEYIKAKLNVVGDNTERFVTNAECNITRSIASDIVSRGEHRPDVYLFSSKYSSFDELFSFGSGRNDRAVYLKDGWIVISDGKTEEALLDTSLIRVPGIHNIENFMTAIALTYHCVDTSIYSEVARDFLGVEHRLEWVRNIDGTDYYNSSIDSSPTRTAAALSALAGRDIVIICGGYDKKIPFEPLAKSLCEHVRAIVLTGATGEKINAVIRSDPSYSEGHPHIVLEKDFEKAVLAAKELSRPNGCVLLSPACASFDAFKNFAQRGNVFKNIVQNL